MFKNEFLLIMEHSFEAVSTGFNKCRIHKVKHKNTKSAHWHDLNPIEVCLKPVVDHRNGNGFLNG